MKFCFILFEDLVRQELEMTTDLRTGTAKLSSPLGTRAAGPRRARAPAPRRCGLPAPTLAGREELRRNTNNACKADNYLDQMISLDQKTIQ